MWNVRFQSVIILFCIAFQENAKKLPLSLFVYIALDGDGHLIPEITNDRLSAVTGRSQTLGDFRLVFPKSASQVLYNYLIGYTPSLDKIQETLMNGLQLFRVKNKDSLPNHYLRLSRKSLPEGMPESRANVIVYQVSSADTYHFLPDSYCADARNCRGELCNRN